MTRAMAIETTPSAAELRTQLTDQGVEAMHIVAPALAIPIHYNDYDVFTSSLADFQEAVRAAGLQDRVHYLAHGETYRFGLR